MKKLIPILLVLLGCTETPQSKEDPDVITPRCDELNEPFSGKSLQFCNRVFEFDPSKNFLSISIFDNPAGIVSDSAAIGYWLENVKQTGDITDYIRIAQEDEGSTYCAEIASGADKSALFAQFRSLYTDPIRSIFRVHSVDNCMPGCGGAF